MIFRNCILSLLGVIGVNRVSRSVLRHRPRILMFHKVYSALEENNHSGFIDTEMFSRILDYISQEYSMYKLKDLMEYYQKHGKYPKDAVVITFDDGFKSFKDLALPILEKYNAPVTIFVCPGLIENGDTIWPDRLLCEFYAGNTILKDRGEMESYIEQLKTLSSQNRNNAIASQLVDVEKESTIDSNSVLMEWNDIKSISRHPLVELGSHSMTHTILANESPEEADFEIVRSKITLEDAIGLPVTSFCYPNGHKRDYRESDVVSLKKAGYKCAVNSVFGFPSKDHSLYELPRFGGDFDSIERARKYIDGIELIQRHLLND